LSFATALLLLCAGFVGGVMNAMAGGASLITFPAMLAVGLPPIIANASNTVSTSLFTVTAAIREWRILPPRDGYFVLACVMCILGGVVGGLLLMQTESRVFEKLVPLLIAVGTLLFAYAKSIQAWIQKVVPGNKHSGAVAAAILLPVSIYGGYFGAGLGVLVMAGLSATSSYDLRVTNAFKNLLGPLANFAAIPVFIWHGSVQWLPALVMIAGGILGAQYGVHLFRTLPAALVRRGIIGVGTLMTFVYAWRYWGAYWIA
jgi:uncharacterized protein